MEKQKNTIRLTESEFHALIEESVKQVLAEGKFGDYMKKIGKAAGKAALYGALGTGALYSIDKGLENQNMYQQELNRQAKELQGPTDVDVKHWIEKSGLEDTPQNRELAWKYLSGEE